MFNERRQAMFQTIFGAPASPYLRLRVRRTHLVEDSLATVSDMDLIPLEHSTAFLF